MTQTLREIKVAKTKQLIRDTFVELIEEKGFESISVRDITLKAGLNRGTFYLHYQDKYDLMEKNQTEILVGLKDAMKDMNPSDLFEHYSNDLKYPPIIKVFEYLTENARFIKVLISSKGDPAFPKKMKNILKTALYEKLVKLIGTENSLTIPYEYSTAFISSAFFGVIEQWLERDVPHTPEEMAIVHLKIVKFMSQILGGMVK